MNDIIKFVIIGSGNIANTYVSAIENIRNAEVVGIVSRNPNQKSNFNISFYQALINVDKQFDAIIVCTPNGLHNKSTMEAAKLGKHVLCEKPIDISVESIDKMISSCKANNVKLGIVYQRRFSSDNPVVKKLLEQNKLGKIFLVDLSVKNYRDDAYYNSAEYRGTYEIDGGGPFMQQASHYIDLYYWYFGKPDKIVSSINTFVHDIEVEDHGAAICVHNSGIIGTITASTATKPGFPAKMEIYSDKGYLVLENDVITHCEIEGLDNPSRRKNINMHTGASTAFVEDPTNHEFVIKDFIESIKHNKEPLISGESARNATEIILEIYKNQI